jgi:hypothetical protein
MRLEELENPREQQKRLYRQAYRQSVVHRRKGV